MSIGGSVLNLSVDQVPERLTQLRHNAENNGTITLCYLGAGQLWWGSSGKLVLIRAGMASTAGTVLAVPLFTTCLMTSSMHNMFGASMSEVYNISVSLT